MRDGLAKIGFVIPAVFSIRSHGQCMRDSIAFHEFTGSPDEWAIQRDSLAHDVGLKVAKWLEGKEQFLVQIGVSSCTVGSVCESRLFPMSM